MLRICYGGWLGLCIWVCAMQSGCGGSHTAAHDGDTQATIVRYVEPQEATVTDYVYVTGRMDAKESVDVRARVTGYLQDILFKPGDEIEKGAPLFIVDPRPYQAIFDQANNQVDLAAARLQLAKADSARSQAIAAKTPGAISTEQLDTDAANAAQAAAALKAAESAREAAELNLKFTSIQSPIDGVVGRDLVTRGNLVTQDSTLLTTIVSQDPIYAYFDVDERSMLNIQKLIREGKIQSVRDGAVMPVELGLTTEPNAYPHEGVIDFVNNSVDPSTGTIQVRGEFPNPKLTSGKARLFTPGLFVRVRMPIGKPHPALLVPQAAIGTDQGQKFLFVVNGENKIEYRSIVVGAQQPDGMQVVEPLPIIREGGAVRLANADEQGEPSIVAGDKVVLNGLQRIRPGMLVDAKPAASSE